MLYARRDGAGELLIGVDQGVPFVQVNGQRSKPGQPIQANQWSHVAVKAEKNNVAAVRGRPSGALAGDRPAGAEHAAGGGRRCNAAAGLASFGAPSTSCACRAWHVPTPCCWPMPSRRAPIRAWSLRRRRAAGRQEPFRLHHRRHAARRLDGRRHAGPDDGLSWAIMIGKGRSWRHLARQCAIQSFHEAAGVPLATWRATAS
jgi:biopolymer transport protein ExbB